MSDNIAVESLKLLRKLEKLTVISSLQPPSLRALKEAVFLGLRDPYGDGDQSRISDVSNSTEHPLRSAWTTLIEVGECTDGEDFSAPLHRAAFLGDKDGVGKWLMEAKKTRGERKALEKRVSMLRLGVLQYAAFGAKNIPRYGKYYRKQPQSDWKAVVQMVIEAGANVNARDVAGCSVLFSATGHNPTAQSLELVPLLFKAGADPNVPNRFSESILCQPIMVGEESSVRALLAIGASLDLADDRGVSPRKMSRIRNRALSKMIAAADMDRLFAKHKCATCLKFGASLRCTTCRSVVFCDRVCQRKLWKVHKRVCGDIWAHGGSLINIDLETMLAKEVLPGVPIPAFQSKINGTFGYPMKPSSADVGKIFTVRVQGPFTAKSTALQKEKTKAFDEVSIVGALKVTQENSAFILVEPNGPGASVHAALTLLTNPCDGVKFDQRYYPARWKRTKNIGDGPTVLRICHTQALSLPRPLW